LCPYHTLNVTAAVVTPIETKWRVTYQT